MLGFKDTIALQTMRKASSGLSQGRLEVLPAYYQTSSDQAVQLDAGNDGVNIKWTQPVDCELTSLSVYITAVATQGVMDINLYDITSGTAELESALGELDCGADADTWVRHTFTAVQLYRNKRYELRVNGTDGDDFSLSARRWNTALGSMFPDTCSSETTTDDWTGTAALQQDSKDALLNIILNSVASDHVPQLTFGRYNGAYIDIPGGGLQTIPEAGVTLDCSALTADTLYYIYIYNSSGTLTLEASTTGTALSGGVEVQSGATNKRYVGRIMARTLISTHEGPVDVVDRREVVNVHNGVIKTVGKFCPYSSNTADADLDTSWEKWNADSEDYRFYLLLEKPTDILFAVTFHPLPSAGDKTINVGLGANGDSPGYERSTIYRTYGGSYELVSHGFTMTLEAGSNYIDPYQKASEASQGLRYLHTTLEEASHIAGSVEA